MRRPSIGGLVVAYLGIAVASAYADVIVPGSVAGVEGNINNGFPFNIAFFSLTSQRYQQLYSSTEFTGPVLISGIAFRPDATIGSAFSSTLPSIQISLSTTSAAVDGLSTTFANNVGGDVTTVFNGALSLSSSFTGPLGGPKNFDISITFATPFLYNPALGNLLLDVRNFGGGATTQSDSQLSGSDSVSRVFTNSLFPAGVNSPTGVSDTQGLVTKFITTAIPEPNSLFLLSAGLVVLGFCRRKFS